MDVYWRTCLYLFTCVGIFVWFLLSLCIVKRSKKHRDLCQLLPSAPPLPIVGHAYYLIKLKPPEVMTYMGGLIKKYGPVVYLELLGLPNVIVIDPADVERVLTSGLHIKKGLEYNTLTAWLCEGLLTSAGEKWQRRRKMLTPTFHFKILETYLPAFNENARLLTKKLTQAESAVDIDHYVSLCTLDAICETIMGTHLGSQMGLAKDYVQAIRSAGEVLLKRTLSFWIRTDFVFYKTKTGQEFKKAIKHLHTFTEKVIKERKEAFRQRNENTSENDKHKYRKSFLDCLIEMQKDNPDTMTDLDIREEVDTFMFEGHDTTSVAISWALYLLGRNPSIQDKVQDELLSIFEDSDRDVTMEDLHKMVYLEMVIKESLRLYPSVPYISRWLTHDLHIKNYVIPAKTNISLIPYLMHRNPDVYSEPNKFKPERFLPENAKQRHPFSYIPFSAGYRNCIGQKFALMEEKVILSSILRHLKVHADQNEDDIQVLPQMILRPCPKLYLKFTPLTPQKNEYVHLNGNIKTR